MGPFWSSFFTQLRSCGRSVALFMITLAVLFVLLVVSAIIYTNNLQGYVIRALPGVGIFAVVWLAITIRRARARRRDRLRRAPLSFDEMRKARAKLVKSRT